MGKSFALALALIWPALAASQVAYKDSWDGWERHMLFHGVVGTALRLEFRDDPWQAMGWTALVGFATEATAEFDRPQNRFSPRDYTSNLIGGLIGVFGVGPGLMAIERASQPGRPPVTMVTWRVPL